MELWIRSQDRTILTKVYDVRIDFHFADKWKVQVNLDRQGDYYLIGIYNSKERALEILNEINERIMIMNTFKLIGIQNEKIAMSFLSVFNEEKLKGIAYPYEMPKE